MKRGERRCREDRPTVYQIKISGKIDPGWADWLSGMEVSYETNGDGEKRSVLTGLVPDQAALRGILDRLWNLNIAVISLTPLDDG